MPRQQARILVVEDETIVARDIVSQLRDLSYDPLAFVADGESAIELSRQLMPDLVLMDIHLAGELDGVATAQRIRNELAIPIVFITAFESDNILDQAKLVEPYGYIIKPFSERELKAVLEMALYKSNVEAQQKKALLKYQAIFDHISDCCITFNQFGCVESCNIASLAFFGCQYGELLGKNISQLISGFESAEDKPFIDFGESENFRSLAKNQNIKAKKFDGNIACVSLSLSRFEVGGSVYFIGLFRDVTEQRKSEEEINRLAFYDPLTDLPNRRLLMDRLSHAMLTAMREQKHCALLFMDLDYFKQLNDRLGHQVGDEFLLQVAQRLKQCVRGCDTIARFGGDEFVLLLERLSDVASEAVNQTKVIATKILSEMSTVFHLKDNLHMSSASIGMVLFRDDSVSRDDLIKKADMAMYQAKSAGRNTARFFDPQMQAVSLARTRLEQNLRQALMANEFSLEFQILVDSLDNPTGAEALLRWSSANYGQVDPSTFIPLAEESGAILEIGQWVLEESCRQLVVWSESAEKRHWTVSINVSGSQFAQKDFVSNVARAISSTGANPHLINLELTESMLAKDPSDAVLKMHQLKATGISFSLDDFGTGYSSLNALKQLPIDTLKIDQSFVKDVIGNSKDAIVAKSIIALGHSLGLKVIAEGVETKEQRNYLADQGCDAYQGYLYGRPLPQAQLLAIQPGIYGHH